GDLALDDPVNNYVSGSSFSGMTIRHLLTHQSGIDHYNTCPTGYNGVWDPSGSLDLVQGCNVCMTPPGSGTLYTTQGSTLLGVIIDAIADNQYSSSYTAWYDTQIRQPANIITLQPAYDDSNPLLADGYDSDGNLLPGGWSDIGWKLPAGGFISNVIDLTRFAEGILNNTFITSTTLGLMSAIDNPSGGASFACNGPDAITSGLAFRIHTVGSSTRIWHNGLNDHGFSTLLYIYPAENAAIVLVANEYEETGLLWTLRQMLEPFVLCPVDRAWISAIGYSEPGTFTCQNEIDIASFTSWSSGTVTMDAGEAVILQPGTTIGTGKSFRAKTGGCNLP
ncbi:MAG: serine hydrolase domain-containing protein, partial [Saprospiraceae bacterium]|nr:serine hydrolase domain-containing protein [Saprospiraceae bacterium]